MMGGVPMATSGDGSNASPLHAYLRVLQRRKWMVILVALLVPAVAVLLSLRQQPRYSATAEVLLNRQNLPLALNGLSDPTALQDPGRYAQTQAQLARNSSLAERVLLARNLHRSPEDFLRNSDVRANPNADLVEFTVRSSDPGLAGTLATEYARQFTIYRREIDTDVIERVRRGVAAQIRDLRASGNTSSPLYASLVDKDQQLETLEALQSSNALLTRAADDSKQIQPRPVQIGILGFGLALILGLGLAFLWEALDTRVRSTEEVADRLRLPLLARLPEPSRQLRRADRLVMLEKPDGIHAESFRILRTNLDFVNLERGARMILITSAIEREGKTTTVANLAVALARAGRDVALVDLDLRRPAIHRFFDLQSGPGITDVALGLLPLEEALTPIDLRTRGPNRAEATVNRNQAQQPGGKLEVMTAGLIPPDPGEFVGTEALRHILSDLQERADFVLIDSPPLLHVGDARALSAFVDGVLIVVRLKMIRRSIAEELDRVLETSSCAKLGFVATGTDISGEYGYGAYYYAGRNREDERQSGVIAPSRGRASMWRRDEARNDFGGRAG